VNGNWTLDPQSPSERDPSGYENNFLTIDDLQKLPVVAGDTSASAMEKKTTSVTESTSPKEVESTEDTSVKESAAVTEAMEEAETQTAVTEHVKVKILEVTAPVTAVAAAGGAAVVEFISGNDDDGGDGGEELASETSALPGTFPDTPLNEKTESATTAPIVEEVQKTDDEPVPNAVVETEPSPAAEISEVETEDKHNLETVTSETDASATGADDFAAALAADKKANTAPTQIPSEAKAVDAPPETNDSFYILPVPSETAPEGTKPLAESTYNKDPEKTTDAESLVPEPIAQKEVSSVLQSEEFQPVTSESNIISSADETTAETTAETTLPEQLQSAALTSSEDTAQTAEKALAGDAPTPPALDVEQTPSELPPEEGVTAIETAADKESDETGPAGPATRKDDDEDVAVETDAKVTHIDPAITPDDAKTSQPNVESLEKSDDAAVVSAPATASIPTQEGVQEVPALGTAIVTDVGEDSQPLKTGVLENGKPLPEQPSTPTATPATPEKTTTTTAAEKGPATPPKDTPVTSPAKTPVSQSSAKKNKRVSGVPSESGSEKKKKGGLWRKLKKVFS
jgi:hypothetical protein